MKYREQIDMKGIIEKVNVELKERIGIKDKK